jgi:Flp pilus assembly protein TadD
VREPVTCAACGAKVREDRVRCPRCGQALEAARARRSRGLSIRTIGIVAGCLALAGVVVIVPRMLSSQPSSTNTAGAGPNQPAERRDAARVVAPVTQQPRPDSQATVGDSRRSGAAAYSRGDVTAALDEFSKAVEANPDDPDALNELGQMLVRAGRASEAIPYFDKAVSIAGDRWAYHFNRARAYAELQEWPNAIAGYDEAARLFPDDYVTQFNRARALQANGDLAGAIAGFERAIQLAPSEPDFHLSHAFALEKAQRPVEAAAAYKQFLALDPRAPQAEKIKARIAQIEGRAPATAAPAASTAGPPAAARP